MPDALDLEALAGRRCSNPDHADCCGNGQLVCDDKHATPCRLSQRAEPWCDSCLIATLAQELREARHEATALETSIEEMSIGVACKQVELWYKADPEAKPTIIHPARVEGIMDAIRHHAKDTGSFARRAIESKYQMDSLRTLLGTDDVEGAVREIVNAAKEVLAVNHVHMRGRKYECSRCKDDHVARIHLRAALEAERNADAE